MRARLAILGAGSRGAGVYGAFVLRRPDLAEVVAIADPRADRLAEAGARHGLDASHLYADWSDLLKAERGLDAIVIATPDQVHLEPALAAIRTGASILLEKPISPTEAGLARLRSAARRRGADITVAHVLRYTPFFARIKELLDRGVIGTLQSIRHAEQIGYWHFAHSYVRGNWRRADISSPMILAKACHDLDILRWLAGAPCTHIASAGRLGHFVAANAPPGATARCTDGCAVERQCPYSALRIYLERLPPADAWPHNVVSLDTSPAGLAAALQTGPYGRCVYMCDNDVADHQVVSLGFANGVSATLNVSAFTRVPTRSIHLMGSHGEIQGDFLTNTITVVDFRIDDVRTGQLTIANDGLHGGGDDGLMADFLRRALDRRRLGASAEAETSLEHSIESHLMAFAAERARLGEERVDFPRRQRSTAPPKPRAENAEAGLSARDETRLE